VEEHAEIEEAVGEALGALGVTGSIAVTGNAIELQKDGAPVEIDIDLVLRQWALLPADMKRRKAQEIARRLADAQRAAAPVMRGGMGGGGSGPPARFWLAIFAGIGALALVGVGRMLLPRLTSDKPEVRVPTEDDSARKDRLARACDAMRDRLYKGASFGPFATEGWVVELWLANRKGQSLRELPALTAVIGGGKLTPAGDDQLSEIKDGALEITDGFSEEMGRQSPAWGGATLVFREGYARAFLEQETRQRFVILADRLADAAGAEAGALYARCGHLKTHDIGAWFRGPDAPTAMAAMVYQMGFFSEGKLLDRGAVGALRMPGGDLDALKKSAIDADTDVLSRMVTAQGGSMNTAHGVSVVFPLSAPMRAVAATRAAAKKMGVGVAGD
jgi:serine/threonine-protein kinase